MSVKQTVDLTEEKKMGVKQMVEVKNAYENNGCWTNGRFDWRKKKGQGRMVEVGDENHGYWMNGRSVWWEKK